MHVPRYQFFDFLWRKAMQTASQSIHQAVECLVRHDLPLEAATGKEGDLVGTPQLAEHVVYERCLAEPGVTFDDCHDHAA